MAPVRPVRVAAMIYRRRRGESSWSTHLSQPGSVQSAARCQRERRCWPSDAPRRLAGLSKVVWRGASNCWRQRPETEPSQATGRKHKNKHLHSTATTTTRETRTKWEEANYMGPASLICLSPLAPLARACRQAASQSGRAGLSRLSRQHSNKSVRAKNRMNSGRIARGASRASR